MSCAPLADRGAAADPAGPRCVATESLAALEGATARRLACLSSRSRLRAVGNSLARRAGACPLPPGGAPLSDRCPVLDRHEEAQHNLGPTSHQPSTMEPGHDTSTLSEHRQEARRRLAAD